MDTARRRCSSRSRHATGTRSSARRSSAGSPRHAETTHPRSPEITLDHPRSPEITRDHPRSPEITPDHPRSPRSTHPSVGSPRTQPTTRARPRRRLHSSGTAPLPRPSRPDLVDISATGVFTAHGGSPSPRPFLDLSWTLTGAFSAHGDDAADDGIGTPDAAAGGGWRCDSRLFTAARGVNRCQTSRCGR